ncbi:MAG TPA: NAD(P)-binding domain-containing protein [Saprospiraceae bacterium]|nr:NAD(P)-binding domain-containing protein [Saprospiraceae bacterium]HPI07189.1 NAD(P)-binding domain-containing protein [Saprospiraceae bacterium]
MLLEEIIIYGVVFLFCLLVIYFYLGKQKKESRIVEGKIEQAKQDGTFEPVSLHPEINLDTCIKSGACIEACPEKDIIGIVNGKATLINASQCIGHGACFHACPVEAISLVIGTQKRGVDLPHVNQNFETNVPGIYIAGELGGMGLIKNSVEQGEAAVINIAQSDFKRDPAMHDLIIIGAGPAGISASLTARQYGLNFLTLEQDSLGGTVYNFPRSKIVMTAPMNLPLHGKVKLFDTSKTELLGLWRPVLEKNNIIIREHAKVESIVMERDGFKVTILSGEVFQTKNVLLAIGRRGSPRKLGIPGESLEKVAYKLLEPENIQGRKVVVVGGGDSAIEAALALMDQNQVVLSYRSEAFSRLKVKNREKLEAAIRHNKLEVLLKSNLTRIEEGNVLMSTEANPTPVAMENDLVFIFAGGELPTQFLEKAGVRITKRFGYTVKKHK